jgi:hypothetical protein
MGLTLTGQNFTETQWPSTWACTIRNQASGVTGPCAISLSTSGWCCVTDINHDSGCLQCITIAFDKCDHDALIQCTLYWIHSILTISTASTHIVSQFLLWLLWCCTAEWPLFHTMSNRRSCDKYPSIQSKASAFAWFCAAILIQWRVLRWDHLSISNVPILATEALNSGVYSMKAIVIHPNIPYLLPHTSLEHDRSLKWSELVAADHFYGVLRLLVGFVVSLVMSRSNLDLRFAVAVGVVVVYDWGEQDIVWKLLTFLWYHQF